MKEPIIRQYASTQRRRDLTSINAQILRHYGEAQWKTGFDLLIRAYFRTMHESVRRQLQCSCGGRRLLQHVEDIAHDVVIRAHLSLMKHEAPLEIQCLNAWLHRIVFRQVCDALRQRSSRERKEQVIDYYENIDGSYYDDPIGAHFLPTSRSWDPYAHVAYVELLRHYRDFTATLNDRARETLRLWILGYRLNEIAARVGLTVNGAAAARSRASDQFATYLRKRGYEGHLTPSSYD